MIGTDWSTEATHPASASSAFRNTKLFQIVMEVLTSSMENNRSIPADVSSNFPYREESRVAAIVAIGAIFAIITTIGNLMVMVSFKIDRQLQTISNYFLFSLAVADIAIGCISIPLMTYYTAMRSWGIGYTMCQFWLCIDYLMSNASVLNLLLISFDRYFSVTRPLSYRPRRTTKKALTMIACTYIISIILWPPWIISWPYIEGKFTVDPGSCVVQFLETNPYVTVGTAIAAFYLPVTIMIILYTRVYWETQKRQKEFRKLQASQFPRRSIRRDTSSNSILKPTERTGSVKRSFFSFSSKKSGTQSRKRTSWLRACTGRSQTSSEDSSEAAVANIDDTSMSSSLFGKKKNTSPPGSPAPTNDDTVSVDTHLESGTTPRNGSTRYRTKEPLDRVDSDSYTVLIELKDEGKRPSVRLSTCESPIKEEVPGGGKTKSDWSSALSRVTRRQTSQKANERKSEKERRKNERKQESKAAKTLSAILFAFIVTWTPYNLIVCWEAFFPRTIPDILFTISYCLCYINSTINPLCYALCNARFRHTYMRIIRCKFGAERPNISRNAYIRRQ